MRDTTFKIHQGEWEESEGLVKKFSRFNSDNKEKIKVRLGFIYFVVLVSSLVVFFIR